LGVEISFWAVFYFFFLDILPDSSAFSRDPYKVPPLSGSVVSELGMLLRLSLLKDHREGKIEDSSPFFASIPLLSFSFLVVRR